MTDAELGEQAAHVTVAPEQAEALERLVLGPTGPHFPFPVPSGTINFDTYLRTFAPFIRPQILPVAPGTDLVTNEVYSTYFGVTFSVDGGGPGAGVYAVKDPTGRSANVATLLAPPLLPWFNAFSGAIRATFASPVMAVSIDACPSLLPENLSPIQNEPYLQAWDANGNLLREVTYPVPPEVNGTRNPTWGTWQTLTITESSDAIKYVEFSVQQGQGGATVIGVFDNLHYQR